MLRTFSIRGINCVFKKFHRFVSVATPITPSKKREDCEEVTATNDSIEKFPSDKYVTRPKENISNVGAVIASLKQPKVLKTSIDSRISKCKTPEELLQLSQMLHLDRKQALKIVTTLSEWSVNGAAEMSKVETDPRFVSLCKSLGKISNVTSASHVDNLSDIPLVLTITSTDEAAKVVSTLTLHQMIQVLTSLAAQKKRSILLLRTLTFRIANSKAVMNVKMCADVLYAISVLNFPNDVILEKICQDLTETIPLCQKSAVIGSICRSLGQLRYRNDRILDCLSEWIICNQQLCRTKELVSILVCLAYVNYIPVSGDKLFDILTSQLTVEDLPTAIAWLDVVWALVTFGKASNEHFRSVLSQNFIERLLSNSESVFLKRKLLNINGAAKFNIDYIGPLIEDNRDINVIPMLRTKEKQILVNSVIDTLASILPSKLYLRNNIDSGMGFLIDAECRFDRKMTPYPLVDKNTGQPMVHVKGKGLKIAVMCWDYHDITKGKVGLTGDNALTVKLLNKAGYGVLSVPHNEFNSKNKLTERVKYIQDKIKSTVINPIP